MFKLTGTDGTRLYDFDLSAGRCTVGRSSDNLIHIPDKTVSRNHAVIEVAPSGDRVFVTDSNSHNGTTVNGVRISSRVELKPGDRVMFGRIDFKLRQANQLDSSQPRSTATLLAESDPEKSVFLSINEALRPLPPKVTDLPELFPTLSEMARLAIVSEPQDVMLQRSLALVNKVIPAERLAVLMTREDSDEIYVAATLLPSGKDPGTFKLSRTIANEMITEKNAILIGDPKQDERFAQQESIIMSDMSSAMAVPLFDEGQVLGILYVDTSNPIQRYNDDFLRLLATFGNIIASRLLNYELLHEREEKKIYDAELRRATLIQQNLLPKEKLEVSGYSVCAFQQQCRAVGGDLYDTATLSDGRVVLLLADVSGKGMGAALLMANIMASFRILYNVTEFSLGDVVNLVSLQLYNSSAAADFATLFVGVLDPIAHELSYINAGHNPPLLVREDGTLEHLEASGTMIGAFDMGSWAETKTTMNLNDLLVVFTDGVTEAEHGEEQYSDERLEKAILGWAELGPEELISKLMADIEGFVGDSPRSDDITVLAVKRVIEC